MGVPTKKSLMAWWSEVACSGDDDLIVAAGTESSLARSLSGRRWG